MQAVHNRLPYSVDECIIGINLYCIIEYYCTPAPTVIGQHKGR